MQTQDLGYNKEFVLVAQAPRTLNADRSKYPKFRLLKEKVLKNESISGVASVRYGFGMELAESYTFNQLNGNPVEALRYYSYLNAKIPIAKRIGMKHYDMNNNI